MKLTNESFQAVRERAADIDGLTFQKLSTLPYTRDWFCLLISLMWWTSLEFRCCSTTKPRKLLSGV